jgi:hypothetical protein
VTVFGSIPTVRRPWKQVVEGWWHCPWSLVIESERVGDRDRERCRLVLDERHHNPRGSVTALGTWGSDPRETGIARDGKLWLCRGKTSELWTNEWRLYWRTCKGA